MPVGAWGVKNSTWKEYGWRDEMERKLRIAVFGAAVITEHEELREETAASGAMFKLALR